MIEQLRGGILRPETVERVRAVDAVDIAVATLCPVVLFVAAGFSGGAIGLIGVSLWVVAPLSAFVVAQLGILLVVPEWPGLGGAALIEAGLILLLLAEVVHEHTDRRTLGVFSTLILLLVGGTLLAITAGIAWWLIALIGLLGTSIASYGPHRYGLIQPEEIDS